MSGVVPGDHQRTRSSPWSCWGIAVFGVIFWVAVPGRAEPGAEEVAVAQRLYQEARRQQEQKQWVLCENTLERAIEILETPGLRFHLAYCKEQQHRWVEALVDYRRAEDLIGGGVEARDVESLLPEAIAAMERQTPTLSLYMKSPPSGTALFLDGKSLSSRLTGTPIPVDPGSRRIEVTAPGHLPFHQTLNLVPEDRRELRIQLVPERASAGAAGPPKQASPSGPPPPQKATPTRTGPVTSQVVVLVGEALLTLGSLGVGVGFTSEAAARERDRDRLRDQLATQDSCAGGAAADPICLAVGLADDDARTARRVATVGYVGAGAFGTAFLLTWWLWPDAEPEAGEGVALRGWLDPSANTVGFAGSF